MFSETQVRLGGLASLAGHRSGIGEGDKQKIRKEDFFVLCIP